MKMEGSSKDAELNEGIKDLELNERTHTTRLAKVKVFLDFGSHIAIGMLVSILASVTWDRSFSSLPEIPQAYVYLAGIIVSSLAGISIIFLLARRMYQQRKRERNETIKRVRIRETHLFKTLERDFERIIKPREVHGG